MNIIIENRASTILYNTILSNNLNKGIFLLPANICPIVPATLFKAKTKFLFYDICLKNLLPNINEIFPIINKGKNITAILYNHTFGIENNPEDKFEEIKSINKDIFIINDSCLLKPKLKIENTYADITLFSTGYSKFVDLGFGGYAFLKKQYLYNNNENQYEEKDHDKLVSDFKKALSSNTKFVYKDSNWLDTNKINLKKEEYFTIIKKRITEVEKNKESINKIYTELINPKFQLDNIFNNWRFNIKVNNKELVLSKIFENNLFASSHYQSLVGIFGKGNGNNAKTIHSKIINLFNDFRFDEEKAKLVSKIINKYAK